MRSAPHTARLLDAATQVEDKLARQDGDEGRRGSRVLEQYGGDPEAEGAKEKRAAAQLAFDALEKSIIRERIAVHKKRPDGRAENEIRPITIPKPA